MLQSFYVFDLTTKSERDIKLFVEMIIRLNLLDREL